IQLRLKWVWITCLLVGVVILLIFLYNSQLWIQGGKLWDLFQDRHQLKKVIKSFGPYSPLAFILLQVIQVVVAPIPGEAIEFLGGYVFGVWGGMVYSMIGLILGSGLAFGIARIFEKQAIERFVSPELRKKFDYLIGHEGVILSFLLFLIPGFPKDTLCYILGLTPMHWGIFLIISTIGRIPGTLMATLQGAKVFEHQYMLFLILLGISALIILVFYIYHDEIHQWIKKMSKAGIQKKSV
ncbi:MAG: TVP38/TMEM64 family protein, partial [Syntrophales bacterium]